MESIKRPYLTVKQLAELWKMTEYSMLDLAVENGLPIRIEKSIFYNGSYGEKFGFGIVPKEAIEYLQRHGKIKLRHLLEEDGSEWMQPPSPEVWKTIRQNMFARVKGGASIAPPRRELPEIQIHQLVVMMKDVEKFKSDHEKLLRQYAANPQEIPCGTVSPLVVGGYVLGKDETILSGWKDIGAELKVSPERAKALCKLHKLTWEGPTRKPTTTKGVLNHWRLPKN